MKKTKKLKMKLKKVKGKFREKTLKLKKVNKKTLNKRMYKGRGPEQKRKRNDGDAVPYSTKQCEQTTEPSDDEHEAHYQELLEHKGCFVFLKNTQIMYLMPTDEKEYQLYQRISDEDSFLNPAVNTRACRRSAEQGEHNTYAVSKLSVGSDVMPYAAIDFKRVIRFKDLVATPVEHESIPKGLKPSFINAQGRREGAKKISVDNTSLDVGVLKALQFGSSIDIYMDDKMLSNY